MVLCCLVPQPRLPGKILKHVNMSAQDACTAASPMYQGGWVHKLTSHKHHTNRSMPMAVYDVLPYMHAHCQHTATSSSCGCGGSSTAMLITVSKQHV